MALATTLVLGSMAFILAAIGTLALAFGLLSRFGNPDSHLAPFALFIVLSAAHMVLLILAMRERARIASSVARGFAIASLLPSLLYAALSSALVGLLLFERISSLLFE